MILVGQFDSPFTRRVAVTLHHYGLPFTRNPLSVFGDFTTLGEINPLRRVPCLILDSEEALIDSGAILDHLDEGAEPSKRLIPREGAIRRQILQKTAIAHGTAEKVVSLSLERFFNPGSGRNRDWDTRCSVQITAGLTALEKDLSQDWLCGAQMSHADVMTACMIGHLMLRVPELFPEASYPRLHRLAARCEALPAFIAARISANETMPAAAT